MGTWIQSYLDTSNVQLENALLSRILVSRKLIPDILPDYFTGQRKRLYEAITEAWEEFNEIDAVYLKSTGFEKEVNSAVQESGSSSQNTIRDLHECWQKREIAKTLLMAPAVYDDQEITTEEVIRRIQEGSSKILLRNHDSKYNHHDSVMSLYNIIVEGSNSNRTMLGYSTGLAELDRFSLGIQRGKTYAIGASKKTGKTQLALKIVIEARKQGGRTIWNRLEMSEHQLNKCALAHYSGIDSNLLGLKLSSENMSKIQIAINSLDELGWELIREKTLPSLRAKVIELKNKGDFAILVVDYIQRLREKSYEGRAQQVEELAKGLADIAVDENIAVIVLTQFDKDAEKLPKDEIPDMSHQKESQGLAEAADLNISMRDPQRSDLVFNEDGSYKLHEIGILVEQRFGLSGGRFRSLADLRMSQFYNHSDPYGKNGKI